MRRERVEQLADGELLLLRSKVAVTPDRLDLLAELLLRLGLGTERLSLLAAFADELAVPVVPNPPGAIALCGLRTTTAVALVREAVAFIAASLSSAPRS
jgi:hypothetical protein